MELTEQIFGGKQPSWIQSQGKGPQPTDAVPVRELVGEVAGLAGASQPVGIRRRGQGTTDVIARHCEDFGFAPKREPLRGFERRSVTRCLAPPWARVAAAWRRGRRGQVGGRQGR